ncbi:MAG: NusG domain II-containing protein [Muribaculaceae bacterium]|nr:NusG domain II-containing protein [Roseburia sp.]MCM1430418.1 NusG domain II-containing protein [Muribaculaceae bacterium]MCM1492386.1 NusG domain II-containing protein [Muribaculaceae bacterium]
MDKKFGKNDLIFIGALCLVCLALLLVFSLPEDGGNGRVTVTVDGKTYGRYPLGENQTVEITDASGTVTNVLVIAEGRADMQEAACPDKLCVRQRAIGRAGETIVCLPNRVVVQVESGKEGALDGFAQ